METGPGSMGAWPEYDRFSHHCNPRLAVTLTHDQELWGMAVWVEKTHGTRGPEFIAEQIGRLGLVGDKGGVELWQEVAQRYEQFLVDQGGHQSS